MFKSVPAFQRQRRSIFFKLSLTFWVQFFVASFAHRYKLSVVAIVHRQSQVRPIPQMLHMVDDGRAPIPAHSLAPLALVIIQFQYFAPELIPFRPGIKVMRFPSLYQRISLDESVPDIIAALPWV